MSQIIIVPDGITKLHTEAVVNAANEGLLQGGGVCGAIFDAAGSNELKSACDSIGHCDTGNAVITPAFGLKDASYIIHAVGPQWTDGNHKEPQLLYSAYIRSLELAKENRCSSIGFPLISAGIFGYPVDKAWRKAIQACNDFISKNTDYEVLIKFGVPNADIRNIGLQTLNDLSYDNDKTKSSVFADIIGFHLPSEPYGCFSNWYHAPFDLAGKHYQNSEQYMMVRKVLLAKRYDLADKIMATSNPEEAKNYASSKYFDNFSEIKDIWDKTSKHIVKNGLKAKYSQNPDILETLLSTDTALLAECSKQDTTWGIGINLHDDAWHEVSNWKGSNYLGIILMELREEFRQEIALYGSVQVCDYTDSEAISVWKMTAGQLKRIPQYYEAIHTYAEQLPVGHVRNCFYYEYTLNDWDIAMRTNMGGGLPILGFYEMKQEIYEVYKRLSGKHYASELFSKEPETWGLRGDPFFWKHLANCLAVTELPISRDKLTETVYTQFTQKTGKPLTEDAQCYVEEFAHGGMSSGYVSGEFWLNKGIPMLIGRMEQ